MWTKIRIFNIVDNEKIRTSAEYYILGVCAKLKCLLIMHKNNHNEWHQFLWNTTYYKGTYTHM